MDFDPNDIPEFEVPANIFDKIYEFSHAHESLRGVLIAYLDPSGQPVIYSKYGSRVIEFGLRKAMEIYLEDLESFNSMYEIDGEDDGGDLED